jgi:hypothetical protein
MDAKTREEIIQKAIGWNVARTMEQIAGVAIDLTEKAVREEILKIMENSVFITDGLKNEIKKKFGICSEKDKIPTDGILAQDYPSNDVEVNVPSEKQVMKKK